MDRIDKVPLTSRGWPVLPLILIVLINGMLFLVFSRVGTAVGAEFGTDGYKEIAENIVKGEGFVYSPGTPSTMMYGAMKREPMYPLWLAAILATTGSLSPAVLCVFQTALSLLSCLLLYRLGSKVFDKQTGILASYVYALHPISFWYTSRFATETIAVPIFLVCLLSIQRFITEFTRGAALRAGLSIAVAALTKSAAVLFLPVVLLFTAVRSRQRKLYAAVCALIVVSSFASIQSLWVLRNYAVSGEVVPFTTMNGVIFFLGNRIIERFDVTKQTAGTEPDHWADALYGSVQADIAAKKPNLSLPALEVRTDRELRTMARRFAFDNPLFLVRKGASGLLFIWFLSDSTAKSIGWALFQVPLLALALIGVQRTGDWPPSKQLLLAVVAIFLLAYIFVSPLARYAMPVVPLIILFAGNALKIVIYPAFSLRRSVVCVEG